uniref:Glutathione S-transferase n=1 Tax=Ixodes ricinus TaxID=34613 RepID=A0A131XW14_IXORI
MVPILGYWDIRGKAQMIRNLLVYKDVAFVDKRYSYGAPPDYAGAEWQADKFSLGLKFPNLPYYIDGDVTLTQSIAILRYLGRKHDLAGRTEEEVTQLDLLEQQALDLQKKLAHTAFDSNWEEARKKYETSLDNELRPWNEFLHGRAWALGGRLTYVDFMLHEALDWIRDFKPEAFQRFPTLLKYLNEFEELPNIKQYMASEKYRKHPFLRRKWTWGVKKTSCQF